mmetsp:Transcript_25072/g.36004  ORF Transcript_25072/g.36004 Transcript_25072/m.36004 type:complete len:206 (+) Transcript_25072:391-1008(+)
MPSGPRESNGELVVGESEVGDGQPAGQQLHGGVGAARSQATGGQLLVEHLQVQRVPVRLLLRSLVAFATLLQLLAPHHHLAKLLGPVRLRLGEKGPSVAAGRLHRHRLAVLRFRCAELRHELLVVDQAVPVGVHRLDEVRYVIRCQVGVAQPAKSSVELSGTQDAVAVSVEGREGLPKGDGSRFEGFHEEDGLRTLSQGLPLIGH